MIITKTEKHTRRLLDRQGSFSQKVAFVPTMGALHNGHLQLVEEAKKNTGFVVVSIFVNPTQFNDPADFAKYPRSIEQDIYLLEGAGADLLLLPEAAEIYPNGTGSLPTYPLGRLEQLLEGKFRPGHFQGVCQVVHRLLDIVQPGLLFMGQKDYQQCMVVKKLISETQLPVKMEVVPTIREADGLAMSSRNRRLSQEQRQQAVIIFQTLQYLAENAYDQSLQQLEQQAAEKLMAAGFEKVDYATIADAHSLEPVTNPSPSQPLVALIAAFLGGVRLIDNMPIPNPIIYPS